MPAGIESDFKRCVSDQISLEPEGVGRYRVFTPFRFEDGDHFGVVLKNDDGKWWLTDEGRTLMHLSYWLDDQELESGTRREIIHSALAAFEIEESDGEFILPVGDGQFGSALFGFVQGLLKITDVSYLSRERVRSTFLEDFRAFIASAVPESRLTFGWVNTALDPQALYPVDCRINGGGLQVLVYALQSENKVKDATINLLQFERWGMPFDSLGIFEDQEALNPKVVAKFTDVCGKTFSNLAGNRDRIRQHLGKLLGL